MKNIRILIALALIAAVVVIAQGGVVAWTARSQANSAGVALAPAEAGVRLQGTVPGNPTVVVGTPGECALLATYCLESAEVVLIAEAITELPGGLTPPEGKTAVVTRMVQVYSDDASTPSVEDILFTLTPALVTGETVAYWDGTQWVELTLKDGQYTIPAGTALPVVISVFTE